jgi:hypothetical protein
MRKCGGVDQGVDAEWVWFHLLTPNLRRLRCQEQERAACDAAVLPLTVRVHGLQDDPL